MSIEKKYVTMPEGSIRLEGVCGHDRKTTQGPGVVICHPHPLMGGSMDNNVVQALFVEFARRGFVALAFNFRGTGRSGGSYGGGEGEIQDVLAALDWLAGQERVRGPDLGVLGYSFGGWIGLQAAVRVGEKVGCTGVVAPPTRLFSFEFLSAYRGSFFYVFGDADEYCPVSREADLMAGPTGRREGRIIAGTDHFFWHREADAARFLCDRFLLCCETSAQRGRPDP